MRRQNDDLRFGMLVLDLVEHFQTFGIGKLQIEQDNGRRIILQRSQPVRGGGRGLDLITVAFQQRLERQQDGTFIIDDENAPVFSGHNARAFDRSAYAASWDKGRVIVVCRHERSET